ncbi:methyltransferase domain-containing protein [Ditylenchus destructor]|nr:methyltransferase domain-containing protein [Ditylenchus destructor]
MQSSFVRSSVTLTAKNSSASGKPDPITTYMPNSESSPENKKLEESVQNGPKNSKEKTVFRPDFGQRYLEEENKVFTYNAWDNVDWPEEKEAEVMSTIERQKTAPMNSGDAEILVERPAVKWEDFYTTHQNKFFMDRKWLTREFSEIFERMECTTDRVYALDVGCGVGNTTFPLLSSGDNLFMYSCDFSPSAVKMLQENSLYNSERCQAFVWDITQPTDKVPECKLDFIFCIYVLSALPPEKTQTAINNLVKLLKPGGMLMLKDYGRFDLTQLRFKSNRFIRDNFYARAGLTKVQNTVDKRLTVNRAKQVKMYRRWIQCKYVKSITDQHRQ